MRKVKPKHLAAVSSRFVIKVVEVESLRDRVTKVKVVIDQRVWKIVFC